VSPKPEPSCLHIRRRNLKKATLLVASLLTLILWGCSAPESGTVVNKKYHEPYEWVGSQCYVYNKNGVCTLTMPVVHHISESWELCLRNGEDEGCRNVDQITWHEYKIGDEYP
jgi:hypothetical protein